MAGSTSDKGGKSGGKKTASGRRSLPRMSSSQGDSPF